MDVRCTPGEATGTASRSRATERGSLTVRPMPKMPIGPEHRARSTDLAPRGSASAQLVLLDEVMWWRTDDLWFWTLEALVTYVRAAAERSAEPVTTICGRIWTR
jgi:hypothetical protein